MNNTPDRPGSLIQVEGIESEKRRQLVDKAIEDTRVLSVTIRRAISDNARQERLRDLMARVESELQQDLYDAM